MPEGSGRVAAGGLGSAQPRLEDRRLLTGKGRYLDDLEIPRCLHAVFVRSPFGHARIRGIDKAEALASPGVLAVLTGEDAVADGLGETSCLVRRLRPDGERIAPAPRPVLVGERPRFVGDPVALVVAETRDQAETAAELLAVDYEELPAVAGLDEVSAGPLVWDHLPGNLGFSIDSGDRAAADAAFAGAAHVTRVQLPISRVIAAPMEPRSAVGFYDEDEGRYRLVTGTQSPHLIRNELVRDVFGLDETALELSSPDVGGGFGLKNAAFPELAAVLWAARRCGRPVKWLCGRNESFAADDHARDNHWDISLAFDGAGRLIGLKALLRANLGAYLSTFGAHCPLNNLAGLTGVYAVKAAVVTVEGYYTNTAPLSPYRGAGRPEASYAIELALDAAARELGIDRVALRQANLIPSESLPWASPFGPLFDSGDYAENMRLALGLADWDGFAVRREASKSRGRLRGIGLANHVEAAGTVMEELAELRFNPDGSAMLLVGTAPQGQGHETALRQVVTELFGLAPDRIRLVHSDTTAVYHGQGTFGSRSVALVSASLTRVREEIVEKAKRLAAHQLECAESDIEFEDGRLRIVGTDRSVALEEIARSSFNLRSLPAGVEPGLTARHIWRPPGNAFPSGCHVCELEVDPETGTVELLDYVAVEDCGRVVNPLLLEGQVHGGLAQGIGQVLLESVVYEPGTGQLLSGSFMDYAMPRAGDLVAFRTAENPHPTPTNPLGIKGAGEAGTVGALPAVMSALLDALAPVGVTALTMPAPPCRVWEAIEAVRTAA